MSWDNPVWTQYGVGSYVAAEGSLAILPRNYKFDQTKQGIIVAHGSGGDALQCWDSVNAPGFQAIVATLAGAGYPVLSCDLGGTGTWGNDTAISRIQSAGAYLQGTLKAKGGKLALLGESMGHTGVMAWAAANAASVSCIVSLMGVVDINATRAAGYVANVDAAYAGGWTEATYGATHNPTTMALANKYAGIPWKGWIGSTDTTVTPADTNLLASRIGATASVVQVTGGHAWSTVANMPPDDVLAFMKTYL